MPNTPTSPADLGTLNPTQEAALDTLVATVNAALAAQATAQPSRTLFCAVPPSQQTGDGAVNQAAVNAYLGVGWSNVEVLQPGAGGVSAPAFVFAV